jgi:cytoskeletal protein RodZ
MTQSTAPGGIGTKLQDARQRAQLSLRQVSDCTKVPVDILQKIERNSISRIPGGLYVRGYVRSFATAVGLDSETTVAEFVAQFPSDSVTFGYPAAQRIETRDVSPAAVPPVPGHAVQKDAFTLPRFTVVGVLAVAIGAFLGTTMVKQLVPARQSRVVAAPAGPEEAVPDGPLPSVPVDMPLGTAVAPETAASPVFAEESGNSDREGSVAASPLAVVVAARSPSWVIATVDGRKAINRLLQVGERETLEARRDLVLTAGDAGAIVMTLNGRLARSIGRAGQTATTYVSSANFRDHLRP